MSRLTRTSIRSPNFSSPAPSPRPNIKTRPKTKAKPKRQLPAEADPVSAGARKKAKKATGKGVNGDAKTEGTNGSQSTGSGSKKGQSQSPDSEIVQTAADDQPDPAEWNDPTIYKPYRSFRRNDGGTSSIHVGEFIHILGAPEPGSSQPNGCRWVGQVKSIRAKSSNEVYMVIKWCYNTDIQLKESGVAPPRGGLAENEVVLSPFEDIISVWTVEGQASVRKFDELDPWQEFIDSDDEYHRAEIHEDKKKKRKIVPYHPIAKNEKPYRPLPYGTTPMVYCPKEGCRKWYHQDKLQKLNTLSVAQITEISKSGLDLLASRPPAAKAKTNDTNANTDADAEADVTVTPSKVKAKERQMEDNIALVLQFAESSITRGDYSIVGNTMAVLEAREIVEAMDKEEDVNDKQTIIARNKVIEEWKKRYMPVEDDEEPLHRWECPKCHGVI